MHTKRWSPAEHALQCRSPYHMLGHVVTDAREIPKTLVRLSLRERPGVMGVTTSFSAAPPVSSPLPEKPTVPFLNVAGW
jgi:hypothetical protein